MTASLGLYGAEFALVLSDELVLRVVLGSQLTPVVFLVVYEVANDPAGSFTLLFCALPTVVFERFSDVLWQRN